MTCIGEVSRHDVVLEIKSPSDTLVRSGAAAPYNGVLTVPELLSLQVGAVVVLRSEKVRRAEGASFANVDLGTGLFVDPTGPAFSSLDEYASDSQTHGTSVGQHGSNAHTHMFYDFLPPSDE